MAINYMQKWANANKINFYSTFTIKGNKEIEGLTFRFGNYGLICYKNKINNLQTLYPITLNLLQGIYEIDKVYQAKPKEEIIEQLENFESSNADLLSKRDCIINKIKSGAFLNNNNVFSCPSTYGLIDNDLCDYEKIDNDKDLCASCWNRVLIFESLMNYKTKIYYYIENDRCELMEMVKDIFYLYMIKLDEIQIKDYLKRYFNKDIIISLESKENQIKIKANLSTIKELIFNGDNNKHIIKFSYIDLDNNKFIFSTEEFINSSIDYI